LWTLLARLLPPIVAGAEFYSPAQLALVCEIGTPAILHHCRDLFPNKEGHYRLNRKEAELVLIRVCAVGRKLPSRESIVARIKAKEGAQ
jgi:hypothetical protein